MCGLSGYSGSFDSSLVHSMAKILKHCGLDDSGTWCEDNIGLG